MLIKPIESVAYNHDEGWSYYVNSTKYFSLIDLMIPMGIILEQRALVEQFDVLLHTASKHLANDYGTEWKKSQPLELKARAIRYELETIDSSFGPLLDSIAKQGLARA
jgi:hypothetical protein